MASHAFRASLLAFSLLLADGQPSRAGNESSPDPESITDAKALDAALERSESIARVSSGEVAYAALCRGAAYAFRLAEPEGDRSSALAQRGYELADRARKLKPKGVEAQYQYALCLGIYLRENKLAGLRRVDDLVSAARRAVDLDGTYDRGGPHRLLALLYAEAPRLVGPGDHDLARKHLARLLAIAGDDEENKLVAVRVHVALGETKEARAELAKTDRRRMDSSLRLERDRLAHDLDD